MIARFSSYFKTQFDSLVGEEDPLFILPEISDEIFEVILNFLYYEEISVQSSWIPALSRAAHYLQISSLKSLSSKNSIESMKRDKRHEENLIIEAKKDEDHYEFQKTFYEDSDTDTNNDTSSESVFELYSQPKYNRNPLLMSVYTANRFGMSSNGAANLINAALLDHNHVSEKDTTNFVTPGKFNLCRKAVENREISKRDKTINQVDCLFFDGKKTGGLVRKPNKKVKRGNLDLYAIIRKAFKNCSVG